MLVKDLGLIEYATALKIQDETVDAVVAKGAEAETILVCQHPPVITVGRAQGAEKEVLSRELPVFEVPRGGRATLHLPGQAVVYPILNMDRFGRDLHAYMRFLENAIIDTLADYRIQAKSIEGKTGVWVPESRKGGERPGGLKKIASIGIAVKKWVSYHGLALNIDCDLNKFSLLNPCGFNSDVMTSVMEELSEEYRRVWEIETRSPVKNVTHRLVENLLTLLEGISE